MFYNSFKPLETLNEFIDASNYKFLIIYSRYDSVKNFVGITCNTLIEKFNVKKENIYYYVIPDINEFSYAINHIVNASKNEGLVFDAVIFIGYLRFTSYYSSYNYFPTTISRTIQKLSIKLDIPILYDLYSDYEKQSSDNYQPIKWAHVAIEMADLHSINRNGNFYKLLNLKNDDDDIILQPNPQSDNIDNDVKQDIINNNYYQSNDESLVIDKNNSQGKTIVLRNSSPIKNIPFGNNNRNIITFKNNDQIISLTYENNNQVNNIILKNNYQNTNIILENKNHTTSILFVNKKNSMNNSLLSKSTTAYGTFINNNHINKSFSSFITSENKKQINKPFSIYNCYVKLQKFFKGNFI